VTLDKEEWRIINEAMFGTVGANAPPPKKYKNS
jgi:hypothetical protein